MIANRERGEEEIRSAGEPIRSLRRRPAKGLGSSRTQASIQAGRQASVCSWVLQGSSRVGLGFLCVVVFGLVGFGLIGVAIHQHESGV